MRRNANVSVSPVIPKETNGSASEQMHLDDAETSRSSGDSFEDRQLGNDIAQSGTWKPLRSRSFLTDNQVAVLHSHFRKNPFPSKYELSAVAEQIGVNKRVVQVSF